MTLDDVNKTFGKMFTGVVVDEIGFPKPTVKVAGITWALEDENTRTCHHKGVNFIAARTRRGEPWIVSVLGEHNRLILPVKCLHVAHLSVAVLRLLDRGDKVAPPAKA